MMLAFLAGNLSFLTAFLARDGSIVAAIACALPASRLWALAIRSYCRAKRMLASL
jgi:lipopolysaccharide export LptBFGC system permease protein LptF